MKKFLVIAALAVAAICLSSCKDGNFEIAYNVDIIGDADGNVNVTFPDGSLDMNGTADLKFHYGNVAEPKGFATKKEAKMATELVEEDFAKEFKAAAASGTYYFSVKGYAEAYGVKVSIDEVLTNRQNEVE